MYTKSVILVETSFTSCGISQPPSFCSGFGYHGVNKKRIPQTFHGFDEYTTQANFEFGTPNLVNGVRHIAKYVFCYWGGVSRDCRL